MSSPSEERPGKRPHSPPPPSAAPPTTRLKPVLSSSSEGGSSNGAPHAPALDEALHTVSAACCHYTWCMCVETANFEPARGKFHGAWRMLVHAQLGPITLMPTSTMYCNVAGSPPPPPSPRVVHTADMQKQFRHCTLPHG